MIWKVKPDIDILNEISKNTLVETLGIRYTEIGDDYIKAEMPVDKRTIQPLGYLHGGATVALAESMGSFGSFLLENQDKQTSVFGIEINASHLRSVKSGHVIGIARPIRLGKSIHVWDIKVYNEREEILSVIRLTTKVSKVS